ncbi:MAG: Hyaluronan synthase [Stenotrophomonas maltophilia]|nr:MAG: Hyaluronan synthase [Stenotrophomonas maltophilia]
MSTKSLDQQISDEASSMSARPLVSVVIPAYNYAHVLARAVKSVATQLDERSELLIIDDGSSDNTPILIEELHDELGNFRSLRKTNGGLASVRNLGISEARGDYLIFLDADDEMAPGALTAIHQHLATHSQSRMVIGGYLTRGCERVAERIPQPLPNNPRERVRGYLIEKSINIANGACVMHREVFTLGLYPERFRNAEDIPVFAQVLANYPCTTLEQSLAIIHRHDDSLRHQFNYSKEIGTELVEEVFRRLHGDWMSLNKAYYTQRCLSLFREAYLVDDDAYAKHFFRMALKHDWRVILKLSYSRKALRLWLNAKRKRKAND